MEDISLDAANMCEGTTITIDEEMVTERLGDMVKSVDLSKFILWENKVRARFIVLHLRSR